MISVEYIYRNIHLMYCEFFVADAGVRCMKVLMTLLPMPGKARLSAEEAFSKMYYVLPVCSDEFCYVFCNQCLP